MKKIEFGFSNSKNPTGSWEGIGINEELPVFSADYYGAVKYEGNSYVVAKVIDDEDTKLPDLLDNFIVRPAIAEMYPDGSGIILLDQQLDEDGQKLENYLNRNDVKNEIHGITDVIRRSEGQIDPCDRLFHFLTINDEVLSTSIDHEVFEAKNEALKNCNLSFSELQLHYQEAQKDSYTR